MKSYQEWYLEVIKHFGTQDATAEALGVAQSTVNGWAKGKHYMSAKTALRVQNKTNGKFEAVNLYPDEIDTTDLSVALPQPQTKTPTVISP